LFSIYPNPSHDYIKISGLTTTENYTIHSIIGTNVYNGTISGNANIDIRNLSKGVYFLKFNKGKTLKFIKE